MLPELTVTSSNYLAITSVTGTAGAGFVTVNHGSLPAWVAGETVDLVAPYYPYRVHLTDGLISSVGATTTLVYWDYSLLTNVSPASAYLIRSGLSHLVPVPLEFRAALTDKIAASLLKEIGDLTNAQVAEQSAIAELAKVMDLLSPRSAKDRQFVVNPNSLMRRGRNARLR
jgi:hypothetical protein